MYYYHMTSLDNLGSIAVQGLLPKNGKNSKLIGDEEAKVFFSEGFEGAIALFIDFDTVFYQIKKRQLEANDKGIENELLKSKKLSDYLGEGVYLRFDGTGIKNERNFENGYTDMTIPPEMLSVCILRNENCNSIIFSRFEIIKYMMAKIQPEQIKYYGTNYEGAPNFANATARIQEKVKKYYQKHQAEIKKYYNSGYELDFLGLNNFINNFIQSRNEKKGCQDRS